MNSVLQDVDIDANFFSDNFIGFNHGRTTDAIYDSNKFNNEFAHGFNNQDLSIIHLNIRSLPRNGNTFTAYLEMLKVKFKIICLSETWLNENRLIDDLFSDYHAYHSMRGIDKSPGGGVSIFVHKSLKSEEICELSCCLEHIESIFIRILGSHNNNITVGTCYRKPTTSNIPDFISSVANAVSRINTNDKKFIAGDFNFNLFDIGTDHNVSAFMDSMLSLGLINTINNATREIGQSISLLDNIFISNSVPYMSGTFYWDISDHYPIFTIVKGIFSRDPGKETIKYRLINDTTLDKFAEALWNHDFINLDNIDNIDESLETLDETIMHYFNIHCPIISKIITNKDREKPWINSFIKYLMKNRENYYKQFKKNRITSDFYKHYRNFVSGKIVESKKAYITDLLNNLKQNMKKTWTFLNGLLKPNKKRSNIYIKKLLINDISVNDDSGICNALNDHYATVGSKISESFGNGNYSSHIIHPNPNSFFFQTLYSWRGKKYYRKHEK